MSARFLVDTVDIELDRVRYLKFSMNAVTIFKQKMGKSLTKIMSEGEQADFSEPELQALLFCGLVHEDRTLTMERISDLFDLAPGDGLQEKLGYCIRKCFQAYGLWAGTDELKKKIREELRCERFPPEKTSISNGANGLPVGSSVSPLPSSAS